jgi:hypothetical protein
MSQGVGARAPSLVREAVRASRFPDDTNAHVRYLLELDLLQKMQFCAACRSECETVRAHAMRPREQLRIFPASHGAGQTRRNVHSVASVYNDLVHVSRSAVLKRRCVCKKLSSRFSDRRIISTDQRYPVA